MTSLPPARLPELQQQPPAPDMAWIPGEWTWQPSHSDREWVWIPGYWITPPEGRHWMPARAWTEGATVRFERGGWSCER